MKEHLVVEVDVLSSSLSYLSRGFGDSSVSLCREMSHQPSIASNYFFFPVLENDKSIQK